MKLTWTAKWIIKVFTSWHLKFSSNSFWKEGDDFLDEVITSEYTWVHHYITESKRRVDEKRWKKKPVKTKTRLLAIKVLITAFETGGKFCFLHRRGNVLENLAALPYHYTISIYLSPERSKRRREFWDQWVSWNIRAQLVN